MSLPILIVVKSFSISILLAIITILVLLVIVALVSAAESAFFSLTPTEMEELKSSGTKTDEKILSFIDAPKRLLATLLISVNFLSIAIVILNSTFIFGEDGLFDFSLSPMLGFIIQVVVITFLILLVGEVTPKIYATQNSLRTTRALVYFVQFLQGLFYPISSFLIFSTSLLDKVIKPKSHNISIGELSQALDLTNDEDMPEEDQKILQGIVKFGNTDVKQIMKPRVDVTAYEFGTGYKKLLEDITNFGFSRMPIYKETLDNIAGVLYTKDLLQYLNNGDDFKWQEIIRPPFYVPENKKIDDLLREFQHKKIHLAVVVDEYGGTSGIVTLEDVIEEIVGEINDEFDDDDLTYSKLDNNNFVFEGKAHLNDVYRIIEIDGEEFEDVKGEADTLAGLIIEIEGRIPTKNEKIKFKNLIFTIESADNRKVKRVKITVVKDEE
ncbi:MAG: gliding motility-associated protein GldE [Bacteroidetes bacterium]|nr:gliding motility-associated protein GldE [Bacteroidota bacterium]